MFRHVFDKGKHILIIYTGIVRTLPIVKIPADVVAYLKCQSKILVISGESQFTISPKVESGL